MFAMPGHPSSSSPFLPKREKRKALFDGQIEGLFAKSRFKAKDGSGKVVSVKSWPEHSALDHEWDNDSPFVRGRGVHKETDRRVTVGHRVMVVLDNVRHHHSGLHRAWRDRCQKSFMVLFMPPYSSKLDPL